MALITCMKLQLEMVVKGQTSCGSGVHRVDIGLTVWVRSYLQGD